MKNNSDTQYDNHGMRWDENHCKVCNKELVDAEGNALEGCIAQSCGCNLIFCYPTCLKLHQRSEGHRT